MGDDLSLRMGARWLALYPYSVAPGQPVHIADAPESRRSFCGLDRCRDAFRQTGDALCSTCEKAARAQMGRDLWTATDIARELGMASPAVARGWLRRAGVRMIRRDASTDAKLYDPEHVSQAREAMPGQGARTDLQRP
jgi:transposase-like protein